MIPEQLGRYDGEEARRGEVEVEELGNEVGSLPVAFVYCFC